MERPILFKGEMVRAILDGVKTQTRRVMKRAFLFGSCISDDTGIINCPFGKIGDRLWVRETWANALDFGYCTGQYFYRSTYKNGGSFDDVKKWRPSIHMPRSASRITLEITDIRVERLHDITEADALAEGTAYYIEAGKSKNEIMSMRSAFMDMWQSYYPGIAENSFVWVVGFKKI